MSLANDFVRALRPYALLCPSPPLSAPLAAPLAVSSTSYIPLHSSMFPQVFSEAKLEICK